jgi:hypothetical protein
MTKGKKPVKIYQFSHIFFSCKLPKTERRQKNSKIYQFQTATRLSSGGFFLAPVKNTEIYKFLLPRSKKCPGPPRSRPTRKKRQPSLDCLLAFIEQAAQRKGREKL